MLPWLIVIRGASFMYFRINEGLWRYVSIWDLKKIFVGVLSGTVIFYGIVVWVIGVTAYPRSVFIIDSILLIGFLVGIRLAVRLFRERKVLSRMKRVLIIGAGDAGAKIVGEMQTHSTSSYKPIGFVDDNPSKLGKRIHGVKVLGARHDLADLLSTLKPEEVLVALPGVDPAIVREVTTILSPFKLPIKTLPRLQDILEGKVSINQIRPLAIEDLLQRPPVDLNPQPVKRLIEGKRVLVTGAGGSIGSELCRQIVGFSPKTLVLYERHENSLYTIGSELTDQGHNLAIHLVLGDIADHERLIETLEEYRPEIIFHAAAHKHVPLMEMNPGEALKNNVLGTRCVAEAAMRFGVGHFVLISTDKAVNPSSVMGATKRAAELVIQAMAQRSSTCFLTVRFGNVLGSNGSVVPRFQEQIRAGGPVTVTHPEVRRYFMSIPEAVGLVLQAATLGEQGAIYLLEMGEQIKLVDLARNLIGLSGHIPEKEIAIEFVGLRPGEKLEEELVGREENAMPSSLEKILKVGSRTSVDGSFLLKVQEMAVTDNLNDHDGVIKNLKHLIPTFIPKQMWEQNGSSGVLSPQVEPAGRLPS
jgi:FlaA1/EpsC-like NDP-sugar epimerase